MWPSAAQLSGTSWQHNYNTSAERMQCDLQQPSSVVHHGNTATTQIQKECNVTFSSPARWYIMATQLQHKYRNNAMWPSAAQLGDTSWQRSCNTNTETMQCDLQQPSSVVHHGNTATTQIQKECNVTFSSPARWYIMATQLQHKYRNNAMWPSAAQLGGTSWQHSCNTNTETMQCDLQQPSSVIHHANTATTQIQKECNVTFSSPARWYIMATQLQHKQKLCNITVSSPARWHIMPIQLQHKQRNHALWHRAL